jgi:hypothetical protein
MHLNVRFFFRAKKAQFEKAVTLPKFGFATSHKLSFETSDKVAYWIAKQKKPHTTGEALVEPGALEIVEMICRLEQKKQLQFACQMM